MKTIDGNKAVILGLAAAGQLSVGETVFSIVNNCEYRIEKTTDENGDEYIGVKEVRK